MSVENEKLDMLETIKCLEATIKRLQRDAEGEKRRISANKGQLTRRLNALALETANRNDEWRRSESQLVRSMGYNKMISTKNATTLKREMEKLKDNNLIQHQKISLPLVMFDNIKENIQFLNKCNSYESIKVILCAILTVLIPSTEKTMKENYSNNAICNLLGLNNKSLPMKHVFAQCESMLELKRLPRVNCTIGMIECIQTNFKVLITYAIHNHILVSNNITIVNYCVGKFVQTDCRKQTEF